VFYYHVKKSLMFMFGSIPNFDVNLFMQDLIEDLKVFNRIVTRCNLLTSAQMKYILKFN